MQRANVYDYNLDINDIEHVVCHIAALWRRLLGVRIKKLKISVNAKRVLYCILKHPGLTQVQIAKKLDIEPQNLLRTLDKLEKLAWISKCADPHDRRIKCLHITPKAQKIITQIDKLNTALKQDVLSGIDTKKIQSAVGNLADIRKNLLKLIEKE